MPDDVTPTTARHYRAFQCPGCWTISTLYSRADEIMECGCGERMTQIDLRDFRGRRLPHRPKREAARRACSYQRSGLCLRLRTRRLRRVGCRRSAQLVWRLHRSRSPGDEMNTDLRATLERHQPEDEWHLLCQVCDAEYPCDASRALAALDAADEALTGRKSKAYAAYQSADARADAAEDQLAAVTQAALDLNLALGKDAWERVGYRLNADKALGDIPGWAAARDAKLQADAREAGRGRLRGIGDQYWANAIRGSDLVNGGPFCTGIAAVIDAMFPLALLSDSKETQTPKTQGPNGFVIEELCDADD